METRATAKYIRVSAFKMRRIADAVRGKKVDDALAVLRFMPSPHAQLVARVVRSAAANAENNYELNPAALRLARIWVDEGPTLKRGQPKARGRFEILHKRSCHITAIVEEEAS